MRLDISCTKFEATPSITGYAEKRFASLEKLLKRFEKGGEIALVLELARTTRHHRKGDVFYAEATIEIPGKPMRATFTGPDIRHAIDQVETKLKKELRRDKGKALAKRKQKHA